MEDKFFEAQYPKDSWEKEIGQIISYTKQGDSCQLVSVPGAGRSTLLGLLAYNKSLREFHLQDQAKTYHFVMISFFDIKNKPQIEAIKLILLNIVASLEDRPLDQTYEKAKQYMTEAILLNDELALFQATKKVITLITQEKGITLVLLFDQFDAYISSLRSAFFESLKILRNVSKYKVSFVFSVYKPLEYFLDSDLFLDFAEFVEGKTIYLPLYDNPSITFRITYIEKTLKKMLDETTKTHLLELTAGHSKLSRLGIHSLLSEETVPKDIETFLLSQKHIQATLNVIWQSLNPAEQTHFLKHLYPSILDDEHSQYLQKVGLMSANTISLPLFAIFIQRQQKNKQVNQKEIIYDSSTNTIKKADLVLSDQLTATEFRLLKFFLEHAEEILERSPIIESVWNENKSLAGVSDQALDQLIFRLRKKIEDDPNNPTHIQTVKGRGFKFSI